ncbi:MAG: hypothetical protein J6K26_09615 [Lachnospiraceae bacterium]|nr:hypothetical protein [Lachnospiraceae bacterium]
MRLRDIRDYISSINIAGDENCYCGKMADKKDRSIGIYPLKQRQPGRIPIGGTEHGSYGTKAISLLVHWNRSPTESEEAAAALQEALISCRDVTVNGMKIKFIFVAYDEPIPVDTDENGIYEYVIECLVYYERSEAK